MLLSTGILLSKVSLDGDSQKQNIPTESLQAAFSRNINLVPIAETEHIHCEVPCSQMDRGHRSVVGHALCIQKIPD